MNWQIYREIEAFSDIWQLQSYRLNRTLLVPELATSWQIKMRALYFLELWKLDKRKYTYFPAQWSSLGVMTISLFHEDIGYCIKSHKTIKCSYLSYMTSYHFEYIISVKIIIYANLCSPYIYQGGGIHPPYFWWICIKHAEWK